MRKHVEAMRRLGHGLKNRIAREEQRRGELGTGSE
jgi:hypothetical protein